MKPLIPVDGATAKLFENTSIVPYETSYDCISGM